ncbi:MAG TPA: hypothetical protein PLJ88_08000, partial [Agitococcus sp.]|nr:hypothetical protein [Agitococcus sp.]
KANTDFIRGTLIKGSGSSMSSQEFSYFNNKGFDLGYIEYGNQFDFDTFNPILKGIEKWLQGEIVPSFFVGIDDDWDMDIMATPLKIKEALDKALSEGLAMQQPSEPETTLQQDVSKSELFKDKNVWAIDDFGKENGMVIYSRDEQDGFSIGIVDKLKQVNMQYTDIDTDQQTNESFSTENITNEQVIEKIKMFIAKHEQKSVELLPVQPISEPPVVEQDNAEKNMTAADFLALGGKEWVKDDMTRIYINAKVFNDLMGTSFGDSNNKFFFDVNTSALMRSYKGKKPQVEKQYEPVQQPTEAEPTPAPNKKMYTPKDILDSDLSIDEKISEAEKLLESDKLNAAKQKIKIDESNKFYLSHVRQAEGGYLFTDLPRNASLTSVVHARIGIDVGFIEYLKNRKENPPKPADTQAQTPPDIGDTVIGDTTLSDLFRSDMAKKANNSPDLRIARQSIFDAEDAAANAIQSNSIAAFSKYADMFPKTYNALLNRIEPPMTNPDRDYLQSIIDGDVDPLTVDMDAVIALAEKYDGDAEITPLLDQALEVINQAEQEASKGI